MGRRMARAGPRTAMLCSHNIMLLCICSFLCICIRRPRVATSVAAPGRRGWDNGERERAESWAQRSPPCVGLRRGARAGWDAEPASNGASSVSALLHRTARAGHNVRALRVPRSQERWACKATTAAFRVQAMANGPSEACALTGMGRGDRAGARGTLTRVRAMGTPVPAGR